MESYNFKQSEFVVSEDTAKWVRLILHLQDVWNEAIVLVDDEDTFTSKFHDHFAAIENLCADWMATVITNNMGWKDRPKNMI